MNTFNIGDKVWHAGRESTPEQVICPECFNKKYLTVILGDDSKVTIDCVGCSVGINPPRGYITYNKQSVEAKLVTICRKTEESDHVEYGFDRAGCAMHIAKDTDLFSTKAEAEIRAKELAEEWNKEQLIKIHRKEKNDRAWSWHVHYYRKTIRDAEKTIKDAKARLDAAKIHKQKSKEEAISELSTS